MNISKPTGGLDWLTALWIIYSCTVFWLMPDWRFSSFSALLVCGCLASIGIWLNFRPSGYLFAFASLAGGVMFVAIMLGYVVPERQFSYRDPLTVTVLLYCVYAGTYWARGGFRPQRTTTREPPTIA